MNEQRGRLQLPHPELYELSRRARENAVELRQRRIDGTEYEYAVFPASLDLPELALYDTFGTVYVSDELDGVHEKYADLVALHEHLELSEKLSGIEHGEAHRRAYVGELLAARTVLPADELIAFVRWRLEGYPEWKGLDVPQVTAALATVLAAEPPDREELYRSVDEHRL